MGGLGLIGRRRAIQSSPTRDQITLDSYVHDAVVMWLDGKEQGDDPNTWIDLAGNNDFTSVGAISLDNGYEFNGSAYMKKENATTFSTDGTIEVVTTLYGNTGTELLYMANNGFAFGRTNKELIVAGGGGNARPSFADPYSALRAGNLYFAASGKNAVINGEAVISSTNNIFSNQSTTSYLGKRGNGSFFKGIIHAIRIHNRVLTTEEMMYNQTIDEKRFKLGIL